MSKRYPCPNGIEDDCGYPACAHATQCERAAEDKRASEERLVSLPVELASDVLDELYELRGERDWWKDEPRCNYQRDYNRLCAEIDALEKLLGRKADNDQEEARSKSELGAELKWNSEADDYNQWDTLGRDEKDDLIARFISANAKITDNL